MSISASYGGRLVPPLLLLFVSAAAGPLRTQESWILHRQSADGAWPCRVAERRPGVSSLVCLALMSAGARWVKPPQEGAVVIGPINATQKSSALTRALRFLRDELQARTARKQCPARDPWNELICAQALAVAARRSPDDVQFACFAKQNQWRVLFNEEPWSMLFGRERGGLKGAVGLRERREERQRLRVWFATLAGISCTPLTKPERKRLSKLHTRLRAWPTQRPEPSSAYDALERSSVRIVTLEPERIAQLASDSKPDLARLLAAPLPWSERARHDPEFLTLASAALLQYGS